MSFSHFLDLFNAVCASLDKFWHYGIIAVGDKNIKVANVSLAIMVILLVAKHYKKIIDFITTKIIADQLCEDRNLIEKLVSIVFGFVFLIVVLQIGNVPLDTFAFLGGALALGVGLGVQNLINNLLSSLIIIFEKPIKVGDLITVDNTIGTVCEIGNRCIKIRNDANAIVFIPSSIVLQTKLINWTRTPLSTYTVKVKILKEHAVVHPVDEIIAILQNILRYDQVKYSKVLLSSVTVSYYIYSLIYKLDIKDDDELFGHYLNCQLIQQLGPEIIIDMVDKGSLK
jgi:small-conductance mechanosensitive channel